MQIIMVFIQVFGIFLQYLSLYIFYNSFGEKRWKSKTILILSIVCIILNILATCFINIQIVFVIFVLILFFLYSYFIKVPIFKRFFLVLIINILSSIFEFFFGLIITFLFNVSIEETKINPVLFIQVVLLSKLALIIVSFFVSKVVNRKSDILRFRIIIPLYLIPLSTFVIMYTLSVFSYYNYDDKKQILSIISSIILVLSNLLAFYIFDYIGKQAYKESKFKFQSKLFDSEKEYYQSLLANQNNSNKIIHDLKNKLFAIRSLLESDVDDAYKRINEICEAVDKNKIMKISTYDSINSLVTNKVNVAKNNGIFVDVKSFISNIDKIDQVDLCMILGNLFDNAIEACKQVKENKKINFELKSMNECLIISMDNPTINEIVQHGVTSKSDKNEHGFGLKNIEEILNEYNGFMSYEIKNMHFSITIVMQGRNNV